MRIENTKTRIITHLRRIVVDPSRIYLVIALFGVLGFILITPPFQGPDEEAHYNRVQYIAHGYFIPTNTGGEVSLPKSIDETLKTVFFDKDIRGRTSEKYEIWRTKKALFKKLNPEKRFSPIMLTYNFLTYLPAVPGVFLSNLFNLSPLFSMYIARLSLAIFAVFVTYFAIKIIPVKKYLFIVLALMPMMLFQQSMVGTDGVSYAIFMLFIAYLFKLYFQEIEISGHQWLYLAILCGLLVWSKPLLYIFLPLTIILSKKKNFWKNIIPIIIGCLVLFGANQLMVSNQTINGQTIGGQPGSPTNVNPKEQLSILTKNPKRFIRVMMNSYLTPFGDDEIRGVIGTFGYADVLYPIWMSYLYISIVSVAIIIDGLKSNKDKHYKQISVILAFVHFMAVNLAIYLTYTPVNFDIVYGVQGRYFLPTVFVVVLFMNIGSINLSAISINKMKKYIIVTLFISVLLALFVTFQRYFMFTP